MLAAVLFLAAVLVNAFCFEPAAIAFLLLYLILNIAYSFGLKRIPILDLVILTFGFVIRLAYGAFLTNTAISGWLYLTVLAAAFYFSAGKRRNEIKRLRDGETRAVLKFYSVEFLDKSMGSCVTMANIFYALWSMDVETKALYGGHQMVLTVPIVWLIMLRYSFDIENDSDGDPVEVVLHDKTLICICAAYCVFMFIMLYVC